MTQAQDFLTASLQHGNLQVDTTDPNPRPMIAVLDAKPGLEDEFRAAIVELVRQVRQEPGCTVFTAYEARDLPGRFYLYEVYADAAAFDAHLKSDHVHTFISAIPTLSTGGPGSLIQLNEIPIPETTATWSTDYSADTDVPRHVVWEVLRDARTGVTSVAGGTRITHRLIIGGPAAAAVGPSLGPQIRADYPAVMDALLAAASIR